MKIDMMSNKLKKCGVRTGDVYILNAPVLTEYGEWRFNGPLTVEQAKAQLNNGFTSAVGHAGTAEYISQKLDIVCAVNRTRVYMKPGDSALVFRVSERLPEGVVLSADELKVLAHELSVLTRIA